MKKTLVLALAAISAGSLARGEFSISTDMTFATEYIFRGIQLADNALHPSIEMKSDAFYAGFWGAIPIDNKNSKGWTDEYDFYVGYSPELSDKVTLDVGVTHYYYPLGDATTEAFIGISTEANGFTPSVYAYYDFDLEALTLQGSIGYSVPLKELGVSLDLSATIGQVDPDQGDSYVYYGVDAVVPYKINENTTLSFGLHWVANDLDIPGADDSFLYGTVGVTVGF
jgi:uncharacterized protein (TIGR02001 family)